MSELQRAGIGAIAAALVTSVASGCLLLGISVSTQQAEVKREVVPKPFEGEEPPPLEATQKAGLFHAPSLGPNVYYFEPDDLWYRFGYRRWYQAFRWNGNWFILEDEPMILRDVKLVIPKLPTLPEYEDEELEADPDDW